MSALYYVPAPAGIARGASRKRDMPPESGRRDARGRPVQVRGSATGVAHRHSERFILISGSERVCPDQVGRVALAHRGSAKSSGGDAGTGGMPVIGR